MCPAPVLERKARFISQVMHGRLDSREITDVGEHSGDSASDAVVPLEPGATGATIDTDTSGLDSGIVPHPDTLGGGGDITP